MARNAKIHLVSAWDSNRSLLLGQMKANEKSNEITAIPELLASLDLTNATITIDAAGCQTGIVEKIRDGGGNYMIALKGNQGTLQEEARNFLPRQGISDTKKLAVKRLQVWKKGMEE